MQIDRSVTKYLLKLQINCSCVVFFLSLILTPLSEQTNDYCVVEYKERNIIAICIFSANIVVIKIVLNEL